MSYLIFTVLIPKIAKYVILCVYLETIKQSVCLDINRRKMAEFTWIINNKNSLSPYNRFVYTTLKNNVFVKIRSTLIKY